MARKNRNAFKLRRHHNNKGIRQIKGGKTKSFIKRLARELNIPYRTG